MYSDVAEQPLTQCLYTWVEGQSVTVPARKFIGRCKGKPVKGEDYCIIHLRAIRKQEKGRQE